MIPRSAICLVVALGCVEPASDGLDTPLDLELLVTLGAASDSISVSGSAEVAIAPNGEYLVIGQPFPNDRLLRYSADGRLIGSVGRPGRGPNEFTIISYLAPAGDSVVVFELDGGVSIVSHDFEVRDLALLSGIVQRGWLTPRGEIVAMGRFPGLPRFPLQRFMKGSHVGGLGPAHTPPDEDRPSIQQRHAAFLADGSAWLVRPDRYELELYDSDGRFVRGYNRVVDWFPDRDYELAIPPEPPSPFITGVAADKNGRLLVLARVANDPFDPKEPRGEGVRLTPTKRQKLYDGILEVFDPTEDRVIASRRFDVPFAGFAAPDQVFTLAETPDRATVINVWRVRYE
jgi:hypothetical protein